MKNLIKNKKYIFLIAIVIIVLCIIIAILVKNNSQKFSNKEENIEINTQDNISDDDSFGEGAVPDEEAVEKQDESGLTVKDMYDGQEESGEFIDFLDRDSQESGGTGYDEGESDMKNDNSGNDSNGNIGDNDNNSSNGEQKENDKTTNTWGPLF